MSDKKKQSEKFLNDEDLIPGKQKMQDEELHLEAKERIQKLEFEFNGPMETMSLHELRIGSIIVSAEKEGNKQFGIVTALNKKGVQSCDYYYAAIPPELPAKSIGYLPAKLNSYWLRRFGFEEQDGNQFAKQLTTELTLVIKSYLWNFYVKHSDSSEFFTNTNSRVEFVHQLQNLCLALSGDELKWKEEVQVKKS